MSRSQRRAQVAAQHIVRLIREIASEIVRSAIVFYSTRGDTNERD